MPLYIFAESSKFTGRRPTLMRDRVWELVMDHF